MESNLRARITALAAAEPALADDLALRGATIEIVEHAGVSVADVRLPAEFARVRLAAGVPLLDTLDLPAVPAVSALFEHLTVATLADPAARQPAEALLLALREHRLHAEQLVGEAVVGHADHVGQLAAAVDLPGQIVLSIADLAARPLLAALASRLGPALRLGVWERGYCPICGSRPALAERVSVADTGAGAPRTDPPVNVTGGTGQSAAEVQLRCGRCVTAWAWTLPRCPDCDTGRLDTIDTLDAPDLGRWTLAGCDACLSYLKIADAPRSDRLTDLLVDDLATWRLDRAAIERGLSRPTDAGYRLEHGDIVGEEHGDD